MMSLLDYINNYDQLKMLTFFPMIDYTKHPSVKWQDDVDFPLTEKTVTYAINTGKSNLVVVDCDMKGEVDGVDNFLTMAEEEKYDLNTFSVETPSGGIHFYFKAPPEIEIKTSAGKALLPGIDIRAKGGCVVGPGSKLKIIENGEEVIREYTIENKTAVIEDLPNWLLEKLLAYQNSKVKKNMKIKTEVSEKTIIRGKDKPAVESSENKEVSRRIALDWALDKMSAAVEGEREVTLNNLSYFMGCKRVEEDKARNLIQKAIEVGLEEQEAVRKFEHGYFSGLKEDEIEFEQIIKQYNSITGTSFKEDPLDTGFYSHLSLSYSFYNSCPDKFIYWTVDESWYEYNDEEGRWVKTSRKNVSKNLDSFMEELVTKIRKNNQKLPANIYKMQERLWTRNYVDSVLDFAEKRFLRNEADLWDKNPYLINVKNGTLDLKKGALIDNDREFYLTHYIPINYKVDATDQYCDKILDSIEESERPYLQLFAGQSLLGFQPKTQVALFLHGRGSNGKTTFLDLLLRTSGTYGKLLPPNVFISDKIGGEKYALADFEGLRVAVIEELPNAKILDSGALKRVVGTQRINSRQIYSRNREFENKSTVFVSCNRLPMINETDEGTWRRVLVINFPYSYKKSKSQLKGNFDRVGNARVLHAANHNDSTAEAFLAWRIEGAMRWVNEERAEYNIPDRIQKNTEDWNENNDLILKFFNDELEISPNSVITEEDLKNCYNDLALSKGNSPMSQRIFIELFTNHSVFFDNNLVSKKNSRILKGFQRDYYIPKNDPNYILREQTMVSYIIGIKFKDKK